MRDFIDAILGQIGSASLNDDEFELITIEEQEYTAELYAEVLLVLDSREAVSNTRDRLKFYFQAKGVTSLTTPSVAQSKIFIGGSLDGCSSFARSSASSGSSGSSSANGLPAGGETGQLLKKASGSDYDAEWVDPSEGGEQGEQGEPGEQGEQGEQGLPGDNGDVGATGATGPAGADGPPIVEINGYGSPTALAGSAQISAPATQREKRYITGSGGAVTGITIAAGTGTRELYLVGTSDANTAMLISSTNVLLSGTWVASLGSLLCLHWTAGLAKWVEAHRNEI